VEEIVVGVPITLAPGQVASPYYPQLPPNFTNPQTQIPHHNQNMPQYQPNVLQGMPPLVGAHQQMFPQLQRQFVFLYLGF
jgi:hypothetical protein